MISKFWSAITRKKTLIYDESTTTFARVLSLLDLVSFGTGSTLGLGVYVLAGVVAKNYAGPAAVISFLLAALVSLLGGLCNAEFAARVPRTGFCYAYCYAGIGELTAFLVGWNLLLAAMLGCAGVATGLSSYLDSLFEKRVSTAVANVFPIDIPYLSSEPDFLALAIVLCITILLVVGMKESSIFNKICTVLNLTTITIIIVACAIKADIKNWQISKHKIEPQYQGQAGNGGYFPFGVAGIIAAVPKCFFGFSGFDASAACSEEAKKPKRDIPLAILITLLLVFVVYFSLSTVLTLAYPYYLLNEDAPFPYVFEEFGWIGVKWVVSIGAIFALSSTALGSLYFVPRVFYAMSTDGLIFKMFSKVHPLTKTPILATLVAGSVEGLMATFLNLDALVDLMSIGSFFAYIIVAMSVIVLRYEKEATTEIEVLNNQNKMNYLGSLININRTKLSSKLTSNIVNISIFVFTLDASIFCLLCVHSSIFVNTIAQYVSWSITGFIMVIMALIIFRQPETTDKISFKVPLVPLVPCLSIVFNIFLMMQLGIFTWAIFLGWMLIGCFMYFFYGITHSEENKEGKM